MSVTGLGREELIAAVRESELLTARLQRRAAELEALFSTARELVRLDDETEVLSRLVERAHGLMGTDVTYLSEVEPGTGALRVRYSTGTVTDRFRDLRVPEGIGLASRVVSTRAPAWVRSYREMTDAPHHERIDDVVEAEGLVSFLGVPLAVGDDVLGALFACNRFEHDFAPDAVLLLSAFADHAAAVLHSARVRAELRDHLAASQLASAIHEELTAAVMSGGTVVDLAATVSRHLDRAVWALDGDGHTLGHPDDARPPRRRLLVDAAARSATSGHAEPLEVEGRRWLVVAIRGADRVIGSLAAEPGGAHADEIARGVLERAAQVAALVSLQRDAIAALGAGRRAAVLLELVDGARREPPAGDSHVRLPGPLTACAVVDVRGRPASHATSIAVEAVGDDGLVAQREESVLVAWAVPDAFDRTERVRRVLAERMREPAVTAVVAELAGSDVPAAVERATRDVRFLPALGVGGVTTASDAFAPYHLLTSSHPEAAERFVGDVLGDVLAWDARRGTLLFETLCAFFDAGEHRQRAAERLRIHKNTVQQRLERVEQLLPGMWSDPEFRFRVHAAVRLERLRRSLAR